MIKLELAIVIILLLVFYQDLKKRAVSFMLLLALTITSIMNWEWRLSAGLWHDDVWRNLIIIAVILLVSTLVQLLITRSAGIGAGDIWVLALTSLGMPPRLLPVFLVISFTASLIAYLGLKKSGKEWETIPLAGIICLFLAVLIIVDVTTAFDRFNFALPLFNLPI